MADEQDDLPKRAGLLAEYEKFSFSLIVALLGFSLFALSQLTLQSGTRLFLVVAIIFLVAASGAAYSMIAALRSIENGRTMMEMAEGGMPAAAEQFKKSDFTNVRLQQRIYMWSALVAAIFVSSGCITLAAVVISYAISRI